MDFQNEALNTRKISRGENTKSLFRRVSSIKLKYEKDRRSVISKFQQHSSKKSEPRKNSDLLRSKSEICKQLQVSLGQYNASDLYVKIIFALFPRLKDDPVLDSNEILLHLQQVFRLNDEQHEELVETAKLTVLPEKSITVEVMEARNIPAKDVNGLSDPFCLVHSSNQPEKFKRTRVIFKTLNPVWEESFNLNVVDVMNETLHIDLMDHNKEDMSMLEKLQSFKSLRSPSKLTVFFKEVSNLRPCQEFIGSVIVPVSEISPQTTETWYKLDNPENAGELCLRTTLNCNKPRDVALHENFLLYYFLATFELEMNCSVEAPYYWHDQLDVKSYYILGQWKAFEGLLQKDVDLAKWRAYTQINSIFPLNPKMMCTLMETALKRVLNGEYDDEELEIFWSCTKTAVNSIIKFITNIHDVLPCPVTVLHTYDMLKILKILANIEDCDCTETDIAFISEILSSASRAVKKGAMAFCRQILSENSSNSIEENNESLLQLKLENLLKAGQILHEDLCEGKALVQQDFKETLDVDYLAITYQVYDELYGKLLKQALEEYNGELLCIFDEELDNEDIFDENCPLVQAGLVVLQVYFAAKNLSKFAPYVVSRNLETSVKHNLCNWFFLSVATWIDNLKGRIKILIKNSLVSTYKADSAQLTSQTLLTKMDTQSGRTVPITGSAVDISQLFFEINKFWMSLNWEDLHQSCVIIRKILEEMYGILIYYGNQLIMAQKIQRKSIGNENDNNAVYKFLEKSCIDMNNINYVKEQVYDLAKKLNISQLVSQLQLIEAHGGENTDSNFKESIRMIKANMLESVDKLIHKFMECCSKAMIPKVQKLLQEISNSTDEFQNEMELNAQFVSHSLRTLKENTEYLTFQEMSSIFWQAIVNQVDVHVTKSVKAKHSQESFQRFSSIITRLHSICWPRDMYFQIRMKSPSTFNTYEDLKQRLYYLEAPLEQLQVEYYQKRYQTQQSKADSKGTFDRVNIRTGFESTSSTMVVEMLNAAVVSLSSFNSDPFQFYVSVKLVPTQLYPKCSAYKTEFKIGQLGPLFAEALKFTIQDEERKNGFLRVALNTSDKLIGEVFIPLNEISQLSSLDNIWCLTISNLVLHKPNKSDLEYLTKLEERSWDSEAMQFCKHEYAKRSIFSEIH